MRMRALTALLLLASAGVARADADTWIVDGKQSTITYHLVHKLHRFDGVSHAVEGKARVPASGPAQVMVRAPVESFDSGNSNRDEHMKETVEAARFPTVEVKALTEGISVPASFPTKVEKIFKAQLGLHGQQQVFELPVTLEFVSANEAHATASFVTSLEAFKIARPSLLFVKVEDELRVDVKLVFRR